MKFASVIHLTIFIFIIMLLTNCNNVISCNFLKKNTINVNNLPYGNNFVELKFDKDFFPGTFDVNSNYMGGSETRWLVPHKGKLFAGISFWGDNPGSDPALGGQVLCKKSASTSWEVDNSWGSEYIGVYALSSISFQSDHNGNPLPMTETILLASLVPADSPATPDIWVRNDTTHNWIMVSLSHKKYERAAARGIFNHIDKVTGIHHVFVGIDGGDLYSGMYDKASYGEIRWNATPELSVKNGYRFLSATIANGEFYVSLIPKPGVPGTGGIYHRIDGRNPEWECVYEWETNPSSYTAGMRGLTAVPDPFGGNHEVLLGVREIPGVVERIDPFDNYSVTVELDVRDYFQSSVGSIQYPASWKNSLYAAYNDICMIKNPQNNESVFLFGVFIAFYDTVIPPNNGAWYLIRSVNGSYDHGYIYDYEHPLAEMEWLRAARTIIPSPFPEEKDDVIYFGGYDSGGSPNHNTAWIYKAHITDNLRPTIPTIRGPSSAKPGDELNYIVSSLDQNGDDLYFFIDWGDNTATDWIGPFASGDEIIINHTWDEKGWYTIRAKAKDTKGAESSWATSPIRMIKKSEITFYSSMFSLKSLVDIFKVHNNLLNHFLLKQNWIKFIEEIVCT